MLTNIYIKTLEAIKSLEKANAQFGKMMAYIACPSELRDSLSDCYKQADIIRAKILRMTTQPHPDVIFLSDYIDLRPDGFENYAELADFLKEAVKSSPQEDQNRIKHVSAFEVFQTASLFAREFKGLPKLTQDFLNASLSFQGSTLIRHLGDKADEFTFGFEN